MDLGYPAGPFETVLKHKRGGSYIENVVANQAVYRIDCAASALTTGLQDELFLYKLWEETLE